MADTLTSQELKTLASFSQITLLDVRRKADRESGPSGIAGAVWKDPEHVDEWASELSKDKPVVIYCVRGGSVSASVQAALKSRDFEVRFVEGGLAAWDAQGFGKGA
ncbi:MAG: rhodanese-like domain-containing protein [Desulfomicrobium sp.]|nr:rhodanese-like domain-containing protein [Desulfomicrobium sp.]